MIKSKKIYCIVFMLFQLSLIHGQDWSVKEITMEYFGEELLNAHHGGFQAAQLEPIDINRDGLKDILHFESTGNLSYASFFLADNVNDDIQYKFDPSFRELLPPLNNYIRIVDYNNDGIEDIFTAPIPGIQGATNALRVYTGSIVDGKLNFTLYEVDDNDFNLMTTQIPGADRTPITIDITDTPGVADVDNDGDIDFLSFESGGSKITFYQNMAIERNLSLDILDFEIGDFCYGGFKESGLSSEIELGLSIGGCGEEGFKDENEITSRSVHSGSTINVMDINGDGLQDLLLGDLSSPNMAYLENGGTVDQSFIVEVDPFFPSSDTSIDFNLFLNPSLIDIDQDGLKDIIATTIDGAGGRNTNNVWYYKQNEIAGIPSFEFQNDMFLADTGFDFGTYAYPQFFDYNNDGLLDLIIGTNGTNNTENNRIKPRIKLLENIGTSTEPKYNLVDEDYLNFSIFEEFTREPAITSGDIDNDGDEDIIIGEMSGFLFFYENESGPNNPASFGDAVYKYQDIKGGVFAQPDLIDINGDGLLDLVIGERNDNTNVDGTLGCLGYFQNIGSANSPLFNPDLSEFPNNPTLGGVTEKLIGITIASLCSPSFIEVQDDILLFTGSQSGQISVYDSIKSNVGNQYRTLSNFVENILEYTNTAIDASDIDNDGFIELVIGNSRGGFNFYDTPYRIDSLSSTENVEEQIDIVISPNPVLDKIMIDVPKTFEKITLRDVYGRRLLETKEIEINCSTLAAGIYFIQILFPDGSMISNKITKVN